MPWQVGTLTDVDVATELGLPTDERVTVATDAARAWGERRRHTMAPTDLWGDPECHRGGVLEGCFQYLRRAAPQGMPSYDTAGDVWSLHLDAERLLTPDPVIA